MNSALILIPIILLICISSIVGIYFKVQENNNQAIKEAADKAKAEADAAELEAKAAEKKAAETLLLKEKAEADEAERKAKAESDLAASKVDIRYDVGERGGPVESDLVCNPGSFVTEVYGGNTEFLDILGVKCSNDEDLGKVGGNPNRGTNPYSLKSDLGFTKLQASRPNGEYGLRHLSMFNDGIKILDNPDEPNRLIGYNMGQPYFTMDCKNPENGGANGKIVGFKLGHGDAIESIQLVCEKRELPSA